VLNRFSDYFEVQQDSAGRRYYIRTHQMRRFFAMTFFWAGGFGGLDTLRWFLGHTNVEHVYHYITETVPGEVLRRVGAEYASKVFGVNYLVRSATTMMAGWVVLLFTLCSLFELLLSSVAFPL
jgi:hypothetical protein